MTPSGAEAVATQSVAEPFDSLVMQAVDRDRIADQIVQLRARLGANRVDEHRAVVESLLREVIVFDRLRLLVCDILEQRAAKGDVDHLHAAADAEHRFLFRRRPMEERRVRRRRAPGRSVRTSRRAVRRRRTVRRRRRPPETARRVDRRSSRSVVSSSARRGMIQGIAPLLERTRTYCWPMTKESGAWPGIGCSVCVAMPMTGRTSMIGDWVRSTSRFQGLRSYVDQWETRTIGAASPSIERSPGVLMPERCYVQAVGVRLQPADE